MRHTPLFRAALLAAFALVTPAVTPAAADGSGPYAAPVLVELYTSQGCNSCPPADAALGRLAARTDLVPLSFHVDYWDYLGWRDTFAKRQHTERQQSYRVSLGQRMVYTPQIVVQGLGGAVGSNAAQVEDLIDLAHAKPASAGIELAAEGGSVAARLMPKPGQGAGAGPAILWVAVYDRVRKVAIARGENRGRELIYHNVVRELRPMAEWDGQTPTSVTLPAPAAGQGLAVWLQKGRTGPILCAAKYEI